MAPILKAVTTVGIVSTAIVSLTAAIGVLSPYGWVTKQAYESDHDIFVSAQAFAHHLAEYVETQQQVAQSDQKLDRLIAYTEIVPELKVQLRLRCMGSNEVQATINRLQNDFYALMDRYYDEPTCEELLSGT